MILDEENPERLLYRSIKPLLVPDPSISDGATSSKVVFSTRHDRRADTGQGSFRRVLQRKRVLLWGWLPRHAGDSFEVGT